MQIVEANYRVSTGPLQFAGDWPGVFIRGDEALGLAAAIDYLQCDGTSLPAGGPIGDLLNQVVDLLKSCRVEDR